MGLNLNVEPPSGDDGAGSRKVNDADGVQRGLNGKLDLGQVRAYYERKKKGEEKGVGESLRDGRPVLRSRITLEIVQGGVVVGCLATLQRSAQCRTSGAGRQYPHRAEKTRGVPIWKSIQDLSGGFQIRNPAEYSAHPRGWVDRISEGEAKQLLLEISDAFKSNLPLDDDPRSITDVPHALGEVKDVVEFLVRIDEFVWRRSQYGADHGVFDSKNSSEVGERVRLRERIARGPSDS